MPGLGHFELNMPRCYFQFIWDFILNRVGKTINFISPNAQKSLQNAYDHHRAWQRFDFFLGILNEMLEPYVNFCTDTTAKPIVEGFKNWCETNVTNEAYFLLFEILITYGPSGIFLFRAGVRRNY